LPALDRIVGKQPTNDTTVEAPAGAPEGAQNPVEPLLLMDRMPHIWCAGCGHRHHGLLLAPRDYLSTYVKLGTIAILVVGLATVTAGVLSIRDIFWPLTVKPGLEFAGYLDSTLMAIFIV